MIPSWNPPDPGLLINYSPSPSFRNSNEFWCQVFRRSGIRFQMAEENDSGFVWMSPRNAQPVTRNRDQKSMNAVRLLRRSFSLQLSQFYIFQKFPIGGAGGNNKPLISVKNT